MRDRMGLLLMIVSLILICCGMIYPADDFFSVNIPSSLWWDSWMAVKELLDLEKLPQYRIYILPEIVDEDYAIQELYGEELECPEGKCWIFFIDEMPPANWSHPCQILFVSISTDEVVQHKCQFPPEKFKEFQDITDKVID